jgi:GT2 family glycosyltransferase/glycosyltransferase involved in cell wall biosynthesis
VALALATACLGHNDSRAAALFAAICARNDVREAWLGLATARRRLGDIAGAADAMAEALRRHVPDPAFAELADNLAREAGEPGWCGMSVDGALTVRTTTPSPRIMRSARRIGEVAVTIGGRHLLGSPIDVAALKAIVGCVRCENGGLTGWAWHPGDPDLDPELTISPVERGSGITIVASATSGRIDGAGLLSRPRGFALAASELRGMFGSLHVRGPDGKDLLGSPLDPRAERIAVAAVQPVAALVPSQRPARPRPPPAVDVVVPVHGSAGHALACLDSVLASLRRGSRLIVIDDASPDRTLAAALTEQARRGRILLIRHRRNHGFVQSANAGVRAAAGHDVVLLNSDTLVAPGWLEELREVAYGSADIGTVTPFSNGARLTGYPDPVAGNDALDLAATRRLDALARRANGRRAIEIPIGVGFCLYIRRACLDTTGLLRADLFAQGYGEENDFCLRARRLGWRHVCAPGVFVAHAGGQSFGAAARHLRARNAPLLERLHPGYTALIQAHADKNPLADARRRLDLARWRTARRRGSEAVILVTHASGGGVERQIATSVERHRARGYRVIVLRPERRGDVRGVVIGDGTDGDFPNLRYALPDELPDLLRLLAAERPRRIELHHLVGHHPAVLAISAALGVPYGVHVHDYAWLCGRVALVGPDQRYCGEPIVRHCEACVAKAGNLIDEDISVAALRRRSAKLLQGADRVVVPSEDAATRIRRHFDAVRPLVQPHEDDEAIADLPPLAATKPCRVCVIGAIGIHKGYHVVLDCALDAAAHHLPLEFVVVGHTIDDRRLLATGRVFVTGRYAAAEAVSLIAAQSAHLALLPSIFPEIWCLGLSEAWNAGLRVVAFDIGAQAERIRRTGRGILLPLGLPAPAINDALIATAGLSPSRRL